MTTTMPQADPLKGVQALHKQGRLDESLALLRDRLRRGQLDPEDLERAGRFLQKMLPHFPDTPRLLRVLLLGQCTTSWLAPCLVAEAWGDGISAAVGEGGYDTVLQDLTRFPPDGDRPDVIVLLPWNQRLRGDAPWHDIVEEELAYWRQAWELAGALRARLVQVGYDWETPSALGSHLDGRPGGRVYLVRTLNARLRETLPHGGYFLDLELVSGLMGRAAFYDPRRYHWTKQPFSEAGAALLARHLWAGVRALTTGPKKVLVVDLDNTLWGGVVGETGPLSIALGDGPDGEAYRAFQTHLRDLGRRGVLLAVASKNDPDNAREAFRSNPEMVLTLDDFGAFEACWEPKGVMLERIAQALNLGLDSFVFFDDNPAEREQVRQALPQVAVVEVPDEPAEYVRALQAGGWFESAELTDEDRERTRQYAVERLRREHERSCASLADYLASLQMEADVRPVTEGDLPRVVQLISKTNQFNLTTRRHSAEELRRLLGLPGAVHLTLRLRDRFGEHGLVAVLLGVPVPGASVPTVRIDTWLMSCRVIGRTVEQFLLGEFQDRCRQLGYHRIVGEYIPTKKNGLVQRLYQDLGFTPLPGGANGAALFELDLRTAGQPQTFVRRKGEAG